MAVFIILVLALVVGAMIVVATAMERAWDASPEVVLAKRIKHALPAEKGGHAYFTDYEISDGNTYWCYHCQAKLTPRGYDLHGSTDGPFGRCSKNPVNQEISVVRK